MLLYTLKDYSVYLTGWRISPQPTKLKSAIKSVWVCAEVDIILRMEVRKKQVPRY